MNMGSSSHNGSDPATQFLAEPFLTIDACTDQIHMMQVLNFSFATQSVRKVSMSMIL